MKNCIKTILISLKYIQYELVNQKDAIKMLLKLHFILKVGQICPKNCICFLQETFVKMVSRRILIYFRNFS